MIGGVFLARKLRIEQKGGFYHVIQRGNNRNFIFNKDEEKGYLIQQIKKYQKGLGYNVYGFVLMNNHYHLILQPMEEKLQVIMHRLNLGYSKYYNNKHLQTGHVFQGRYKAILIQDERYLLSLLRYIHQNPIRAKMIKNIWDYKWSSDYFYRTNFKDAWIDIDLVLNMISDNRKEAINKYCEFMDEVRQENEAFEDVDIVGEEAYKKMMKTTVEKSKRESLDIILKNSGVSKEQFLLIKNRSRKRSLTSFKIKYIEDALKYQYSMEKIGENIGISQASVWEIAQKIK